MLADEAKKKATKSFDQARPGLMKSPNRPWQSVMIRYLDPRRFPNSPTHLREPHMVYRLVDYSIACEEQQVYCSIFILINI